MLLHEKFDSLNISQKKAIAVPTDRACIVLAGPGTGKTTVLSYRVAFLLQKNILPYNILALTFTNKASYEMKQRIKILGGELANKVTSLTFHAFGKNVLHTMIHHLGYPNHFAIYDQEESKSLIKKIVKELQYDPKRYPAQLVLRKISDAKTSFLTADDYAQEEQLLEEDKRKQMSGIYKIYKEYEKKCKKIGAVDFDDLLWLTWQLFSQFPNCLDHFQQRYTYILVDEFQDTSSIQYEILVMVNKKKNLFIIGDNDQSIYAFRKAKIENIYRFKRDFPNHIFISLEENYRSTPNILQAANYLIQNNKQAFTKKLFTKKKKGDDIQFYKAKNGLAEVRWVINTITKIRNKETIPYKDIAILYRTNHQSILFEKGFSQAQIPYHLVGGYSLFKKKEVKDLLAYLRLLVHPEEEQAFRRIINFPKRGMGEVFMKKLDQICQKEELSLWEALRSSKSSFSSRLQKEIEEFIRSIEQHKQKLYKESMATVSNSIITMLIEKEAYPKLPGLDNNPKEENLKTLLGTLKGFEEDSCHSSSQACLISFLQDVSLLTSDEEKKEQKDAILLMTVHSAKGLEFPYVFLVGMEERLFPSSQAFTLQKEMEEERRLCFVGITRAKKFLALTCAEKRYLFGREKVASPSRFIKEMKLLPDFIEVSKLKKSNNFIDKKWKKLYKSSRFTYQKEEESWPTGSQIIHPIFGKATLLEYIDEPYGKKVKLDFIHHGLKTILLSRTKLRKIEN